MIDFIIHTIKSSLPLSVAIAFITIAMILFAVIVIALEAVKYSNDYIKKFRYALFGLFVIILLCNVPVAYDLYMRLTFKDTNLLSDFATLASRFGYFCVGLGGLIIAFLIRWINKTHLKLEDK